MSRKQTIVMEWLRMNAPHPLTIRTAVGLIGGNIYDNHGKHVGALLSNMVRRGLLQRTRPGEFVLTAHQDSRAFKLEGEE